MTDIKQFQEQIQQKIKNLVLEFGQGKISNEQFDIIYERYYNQLNMAMQVLEGTADQVESSPISTIAIRDATSGKALGLGIYHHQSGTMIETLGNFDISPEVMSPTLNDISDKLQNNEFLEPITKKLVSGIWIVFMARDYTTAIVIFRNEPAPMQIRQLERLLHDFESANQSLLEKMNVDSTKLARPFSVFVHKKLK